MSNTLDLIFTADENTINNLYHRAPLGKSHHNLLTFDLNCKTTININNTKTSYLYNKGNFEAMRAEIRSLNWENELASLNRNESWTFFENTTRKAIEKFIPKHKFRFGPNKNKMCNVYTVLVSDDIHCDSPEFTGILWDSPDFIGLTGVHPIHRNTSESH